GVIRDVADGLHFDHRHSTPGVLVDDRYYEGALSRLGQERNAKSQKRDSEPRRPVPSCSHRSAFHSVDRKPPQPHRRRSTVNLTRNALLVELPGGVLPRIGNDMWASRTVARASAIAGALSANIGSHSDGKPAQKNS